MSAPFLIQVLGGHRLEDGLRTDDRLGLDDGWWWLDSHDQPHGPFATREGAEEAATDCPLDLPTLYSALIKGRFRHLAEEDPTFDGVDGEGFIWDEGPGLPAGVTVVCGLEADGPRFQIVREDDNGGSERWAYRPLILAGIIRL